MPEAPRWRPPNGHRARRRGEHVTRPPKAWLTALSLSRTTRTATTPVVAAPGPRRAIRKRPPGPGAWPSLPHSREAVAQTTQGSGASICDGTTHVQRRPPARLSGTAARQTGESVARLPPLCDPGLSADLRDSLTRKRHSSKVRPRMPRCMECSTRPPHADVGHLTSPCEPFLGRQRARPGGQLGPTPGPRLPSWG
jgi:hypothetical protein